MGRSTMWVPTAAIGQAVWMVQTPDTCTSIVGLPTWSATSELTAFLSVILRISHETFDAFVAYVT